MFICQTTSNDMTSNLMENLAQKPNFTMMAFAVRPTQNDVIRDQPITAQQLLSRPMRSSLCYVSGARGHNYRETPQQSGGVSQHRFSKYLLARGEHPATKVLEGKVTRQLLLRNLKSNK